MNQETQTNPEKIDKTHRLSKLGASALLAVSLLAGATGCGLNQTVEFSSSTHKYVVEEGDTLWGATYDIEGSDAVNDKHKIIDYIEEMPENTQDGGALADGQLNPGDHLIVPDSVEVE